MHTKCQYKRGFTLIELSIVLVIIGLIVGGVLAGQSLIRAAEIHSVVTDLQKFDTAINTFQGKYDALPGDMPNATSYWGAAGGNGTGNDAACFNTVSTGAATCNGSGDGKLWDGYGSSPTFYYEAYRAWQHLANSGLVAGAYTGTQNPSAPPPSLPGVNIPLRALVA